MFSSDRHWLIIMLIVAIYVIFIYFGSNILYYFSVVDNDIVVRFVISSKLINPNTNFTSLFLC